ncbi:MAG: hypothetical protein LN409_04720, partial [Candidatus Thermoplasmatota archaeon]|nr:hypothetical protein [Candidatus Thermoplasmatota archaeon]
ATDDSSGADGDDTTEKETGPPTIAEALARAKEQLEKTGTMMTAADDDEGGDADEEEDDAEDQGESGTEDEEEEEGEAEESGEEDEEGDEDEEAAEGDADDEDDEVDDKKGEGGEDEEEGEGEEKKTHTVKLPSREAGGEDVEIEVDDEETAARLNQMRNGYMNGEQVREQQVLLQTSQNELANISESFEVDPAGFLMEYTDAKDLPQVALSLMVQPGVWEALQKVVNALIEDPKELRTLQAESKAARLETVAELTKTREARAEQTKNGQQLSEAIDLIVPDTMEGAIRTQLIQDLTRDVVEHIDRNKLQTLEVKDLPTIVAARLETNGIDPLEARKSIQDGARSRGKPSTKKGPRKKPKSGKELVKASAKRKKVAAAPGPGKKSAPTQPTKLPAGQSIKERLATVRKQGGMGRFLGT